VLVRAHDRGADAVLTEVEGETHDGLPSVRGGEVEELARHRLLQAVDADDAVTHRGDHALIGVDHRGLEVGDALPQDLADLVTADCHQLSLSSLWCGSL